MGEIQKKINRLKPYVVGIRIIEGLQVVDATFKDGWYVPESKGTIKREVVDPQKNYYMFFSEDSKIEFDDLVDHIEGIINLNVEREKKYQLLKVKIAELQKLFNEHPLKKLEGLKIGFSSELTDTLPSMDSIRAGIYTDIPTPTNEESTNNEQTPPTIEANGIVDGELVHNATVEEKQSFSVGQNNKVNVGGQEVELPPKQKIEVESYDLPSDMTESECDCPDDQACPKCIDRKGL